MNLARLGGWLAPAKSRWPWGKRPDGLLDRLSAVGDAALRALLDDSVLGIAVVDAEGRLIRVNNSLRRLVSRDCDLSPGQPVLGMFCDERTHSISEELAAVLRGRAVLRGYACLIRGRGEGGVQAVEAAATPLRESDATVVGAVLQIIDMSAQKELEAQLNQSQKLQAIGQLAGGIAHDFNNLLTAVIGAADDGLDRAQSDAETIEDLRQIRASAERGADLVKQLLAFGRQQALQPRPIAINQALEAISMLLRRLLGNSVSLELQLEQPGATIHVDPTQLDQVLVNLAVNARDAMPAGGQLTVRTGHMDLFRPLVRDKETIPPGHYVMVEVQDTGVGIPRDVLPRIFEPFFTTRRERGGNGLGLSTVHGIVRQSNGFVAVDSAVSKGTRVRVYLPRITGDQAAVPTPHEGLAAAVVSRPVRQRVILLVDDEEGVRRVAERALTRQGWRVLAAEGGEQALALMADPAVASEVAAVVSDLAMPGLDGYAVVQAVRGMRPGLPAVVTSGYAEEALRKQFAAADIEFLPKPYAIKHLIAVTEAQLCRQSQATQADPATQASPVTQASPAAHELAFDFRSFEQRETNLLTSKVTAGDFGAAVEPTPESTTAPTTG